MPLDYGWRRVRQRGESDEDELPPEEARSWLSLALFSACALVMATILVSATARAGGAPTTPPALGQDGKPAVRARGPRSRPARSADSEYRPLLVQTGLVPDSEVDFAVALTSTHANGLRFVPAGIDLLSRACPPFHIDPNRTVRERQAQRALTALLAREQMLSAETPGARSRCAVSARCGVAAPARVLRLQDVCVRNETYYLLSDRDTPAADALRMIGADPVHDWWGHPKKRKYFDRFVREARGLGAVPGGAGALWLNGTWAAPLLRFRFGHSNIFHTFQEEISALGTFSRCARTGGGSAMRFLLHQRRRLLPSRSSAARLWELATDGSPLFYVPPDAAATTFCFRRLHLELSSAEAFLAPVFDMCARVDGLSAPAAFPDWPDWPAGEGTLDGTDVLARHARTRLGLSPPRVLPVAQQRAWLAPRVLLVHRLKNRRILNAALLAWVLRDAGMDVTVVALECLPLEAQIAVATNCSTYVGVHGAGLTFGKLTPTDALLLELRTAPCDEVTNGNPYNMRFKHVILGAPRDASMPNGSCPAPWRVNRRDYEATADIAAVLREIRDKDPVASRGRARQGWWPALAPRAAAVRAGVGDAR
jgi:hypothetical protein